MISVKFPDETDDQQAAEIIASLKVFDFTQPLELMDAQTKNIYYRLRRVALMAQATEFEADKGRGDASLLPDGKIYTESQVIEALGEDYAQGVIINKRCCG